MLPRDAIQEEEALAARVVAALRAARAGQPDPDRPYFAHLRIRVQGRARDVLFSSATFVDREREIRLVDWRQSPLFRVLLEYAPGDEYDEEVEGVRLSGEVLLSHRVTFDAGRLKEVWVAREHGSAVSFDNPSPAGMRSVSRIHVPPAAAMLDPSQRAAIQREATRALLVLGSAGCGKTTVALHRLAALAVRAPERFPAAGSCVVVPERGLARLTRRLLDHLGLEHARATTFDDWVALQARRLLVDLPAREWRDAPAAVVRFKRHPAFTGLIPDFVRTLKKTDAQRHDRIYPLLLRLLGDRSLLERAVAHSAGDLHAGMVDDMVRHWRRQTAETAEEAYAHVDPERLRALDERPLDAGTPEEVAGTLDVEDYALLLELHWTLTGARHTEHGQLETLRALVVDEAQELTPVELACLGRALDPGSSLIVAGDQAQQIDDTGAFGGWPVAMAALGMPEHDCVTLATSHRCTAQVTELAHAVLGSQAPLEAPRDARAGSPVLRSTVLDPGRRALELHDVLRDLMDRVPNATVAVIAANEVQARLCHRGLGDSLDARLVLDGDFSFAPGVEVTTTRQVKGLEFDYVVIPDAAAGLYPDQPASRRLLHVAITRTVVQLWIVTLGKASPILQA